MAHTNVGATFFRAARNTDDDSARTLSVSAAEGFIWRVRPTFNLMLEAIWSRREGVVKPEATTHTQEAFVSPGFRVAINRPSGLQIVPGLPAPIGVGPSRGDSGVLLYLSFEHPIHRATR